MGPYIFRVFAVKLRHLHLFSMLAEYYMIRFDKFLHHFGGFLPVFSARLPPVSPSCRQ